jgi:hypothetical protein
MLQSAMAERAVALENTSPELESAPKSRPTPYVVKPASAPPKTSKKRRTTTSKLPGRERLFTIVGLAAALWLMLGAVFFLCAILL